MRWSGTRRRREAGGGIDRGMGGMRQGCVAGEGWPRVAGPALGRHAVAPMAGRLVAWRYDCMKKMYVVSVERTQLTPFWYWSPACAAAAGPHPVAG
jgi:hypothetical protein